MYQKKRLGEGDSMDEQALDIISVYGFCQSDIGRKVSAEQEKWSEYHPAVDVPGVRNLTYEYDIQCLTGSYIEDKASDLLSTLVDELRKPCQSIFIGHSFGGIIVKEALLLARMKKVSFTERIRGLIFFGTHHATNATDLTAKIPVQSNIELHLQPSERHVEQYCHDLNSLSYIFWRTFLSYQVLYVCFEDCIDSCNLVQERYHIIRKGPQPSFFDYADFDYSVSGLTSMPELQRLLDNSVNPVLDAVTQTHKFWISQSDRYLPRTLQYLSGIPRSPSGSLQCLLRAPRCLAGTGSWILETVEYSTWRMARCSSLLWLRGKPGSGKSMLSKFMMENMLETSHQEDVHVYFLAEHYRLSDLTRGLLRSLIHAIANHRNYETDAVQHILASIEDRSRPLPPWGFQRHLRAILYSDLSASRVYYFTLDGVDDSSWVKEYVLNMFFNSGLLSNERHQIKCMVCSRVVLVPPDGLMTLQVDLDRETTRKDVAFFVRSSIQHMSVKHPDHAGKLRSLETRLIDKIQQNFLLATLTVKEISRTISSSTGVSDTFTGDWPSELGEMYSKLLRSIPSHYNLLAKRIFTWIIHAMRPLHISELREALMVKTPTVIPASELFCSGGYQEFSLKEDLSKICGGLVTISQDHTVEFIHRTVREYLLTQHENGCSEEFYVKWSYAHNYLAEACLQYLVTDQNSARAMLDYHDYWLTSAKPSYECPFSQYASMYWSEHYRLAEPYSIYLPGMLQTSLERLMLQKEAKCPTCKITDGPFHISVHMFYACIQMGLVNLGRTYLEMGVDVNTTYYPYEETPLHLAVASCHLDMVKMLLTREASIEASTTGLGRTPLHLACSLGNIEMCILMIESGANKNATTEKYGETPLHLAVENGHLDIVQYLLDTGADTNVATYISGETPLHIAAASGLWEESILLLGGEVRIGAVVSCINTISAREWDPMRPVHRVVEHQIPYHDKRHNDRQTWDFREFCKFLPTNLYDTTGLNYEFESPLGKRYANVEARTKAGWTALHLAAAHGHQAMCEVLLKYGANPTATTPFGKAATQLARESGHLQLVSMLGPPLLDKISIPPISQISNMKSVSERFRQTKRDHRQIIKHLDDRSWTVSDGFRQRRKNDSQTTKQLEDHNNGLSTNLASLQCTQDMNQSDDFYDKSTKGEDGWIMLNYPVS